MSDSVKMRFRTDGWHESDTYKADPPITPGDVWRIRWYKEDVNGKSIDGPIAGYAICCIGCGKVHHWTSSSNCKSLAGNSSCAHSGTSSCWEWSGSAEEGTLTASPSLQVSHSDEKCHWHGFIQNGIIHA